MEKGTNSAADHPTRPEAELTDRLPNALASDANTSKMNILPNPKNYVLCFEDFRVWRGEGVRPEFAQSPRLR
jgi:hypothetical protein